MQKKMLVLGVEAKEKFNLRGEGRKPWRKNSLDQDGRQPRRKLVWGCMSAGAMLKISLDWEGRKPCPKMYWKVSEGGAMSKNSTDQDGRKLCPKFNLRGEGRKPWRNLYWMYGMSAESVWGAMGKC